MRDLNSELKGLDPFNDLSPVITRDYGKSCIREKSKDELAQDEQSNAIRFFRQSLNELEEFKGLKQLNRPPVFCWAWKFRFNQTKRTDFDSIIDQFVENSTMFDEQKV